LIGCLELPPEAQNLIIKAKIAFFAMKKIKTILLKNYLLGCRNL